MARASMRAIVLAGALLLAIAALAGSAQAAVYWVSSSLVTRSNFDGSQEAAITPWPAPLGSREEVRGCEGVAVDESHLYWADPFRGAIVRANLDGGDVEWSFVSGLENPCGVAVDGSHVYWADNVAGTIGRASLGGTEVEREFVSGLREPCGVAVAGGSLYWSARTMHGYADSIYLGRRLLAIDSDSVLLEDPGFCGLAVDSEHIYMGGYFHSIGRAKLDGSDFESSFITGLERPTAVAVYGGHIYWAQGNPVHPLIEGTALEGAHVPQIVSADPPGLPEGIAADGTVVPPPPPPVPTLTPSQSPPVIGHDFFFRNVRHAKATASTFVSLEFPSAGSFEVSAPKGLSVRVVSGRAPRNVLAGPESRLLRIAPARGRAGEFWRAKLDRRRKLRFAVRVDFHGADGSSTVKRGSLSLVAPRGGTRSEG
jgi:hypothetical protein